MRTLACVLIALFCALLVSAQMEKRASMGGAAFGAMDRLPLELIQKFYRIGQKRTQPDGPYRPNLSSYYSMF
ncbi:hypothetical protein RB195_002289 [Necator americanus]|uniref:Uncharacterized protein n=2 Tax=Necator americanus TaxID=51031 RepID=A0ABR1DIB4_NECAM|nr:hypothetical protein NECAME_08244 [Necator americanus]ETN81985.1 hypothetical protein NECAME_08244 [Necator americanus]